MLYVGMPCLCVVHSTNKRACRCIVTVAQAVKEVHEAQERLVKCRAKESMLRAHLYQIQAAMATRLKQMSLSQVGHVRANRARLSASPTLEVVCN